jgi:hypothetical protein
MNWGSSSVEYIEEFYKWIRPKDARNNEAFRALIEKVTRNTYSTFEHWQSDGSPNIKEKASLCFGASAQFHDTHIEEHFAKFIHFWNSFRKGNPVQPDFSEYETQSKELRRKYRLIPTEQLPFAVQLQRYLHSQDFEHKAKFDDIKNFIDTRSSGYVTIEGRTGTQKSLLTAYTAKTLYESGQYQCIWHFNEMASGHNRSSDLLRTLFPQLKDIYPCLENERFNLEYERVLNLDSGYAAFYQTIFDQLAYERKLINGKLVIVVDALDEVSQLDPSRQESVNTLFLPQSLINNTFVVVSSKNTTRETYIGYKLEIRFPEAETCQKDAEVVTEAKWLDSFNQDGSLPLEFESNSLNQRNTSGNLREYITDSKNKKISDQKPIQQSEIPLCKSLSNVPLRDMKLGFGLHSRFDILSREERILLLLSTRATGITLHEASRQIAFNTDRLRQALDRLTSELLLVVENRNEAKCWKISDAGKLFLKNNPGAEWL